MSSLLKEKYALTKLRKELEERKGKLCRGYKGFGHLAQNCRKKREEEKEVVIPQNNSEILSSRVMQCGIEERAARSIRMVAVKCFKCRKVHQEERRPARPIREKAQEGEKRLRRVEEGEVACPVQGEAQQG